MRSMHGRVLALAACALALAAWGVVLLSPADAGPDRRPFPHAKHVDDQGMACSVCHTGADRPEEVTTAPSPVSCRSCHEEADVAAFFPAGSYHGEGFLERHQMESRTGNDRCSTCHKDSETCANCHHGENVDILVHPRNWEFIHPVEARHRDIDCASCHRRAEFCSDCHAAEGVMPGSHRISGWTSGPVHGAEARRDVESCAACHSQATPVCLDCHGEP